MDRVIDPKKPIVTAVAVPQPEDGAVVYPSISGPLEEEVDNNAELAMWKGRKLAVLLPVYKEFCPATHFTLFANYAKYGPEKIALFQKERTVIHEARNYLVHKALKSDAEWFQFCDNDMGLPCGSAGLINGMYGGAIPEPGASMVAISRMMSHPPAMKIVGALYFGRHRYGRAQCAMGFNQGGDVESDALRGHKKYRSPIPMEWVGTGFLKIHRSVFEDYKRAIDDGEFPDCKPLKPDRPYGFFSPIQVGMGEDISFGVRCKKLGIDSFLDPVLECLHFGGTAYHSGNTKNKPL